MTEIDFLEWVTPRRTVRSLNIYRPARVCSCLSFHGDRGASQAVKRKPFYRVLAIVAPALLVLFLILTGKSRAEELPANFSGQIVSGADGVPVEHAQVLLDRTPGDGNPEYKIDTDLFGFFVLKNVAAGNYKLGVNTTQYIPYVTNLTIASGISTNKLIKLVPIDGKVVFDIYFQVWCSTTAANLAGANIQIEYWRPGGNLSGGPDNVVNLTADAAGTAIASQSVDGYYRFTISRIGWQTLVYQPGNGPWVVAGDKVRLNQSASATVFLDPVLTDLKVTVTGYDPVLDKASQPLKNMVVKLTGLSFDNPPVALVPATSLLSLTDGTATFKNLPPIQWQVDVGAPGYFPSQAVVTPDDFGQLPPVKIAMDLESTKVEVVLSSIYQTNAAVSGAEVHLEGVLNSTTEGINRKLNTQPSDFDNTASALFENLLPGRYYIRVQHQVTLSGLPTRSGPLPPGPDSFHVDFFPRESFADVGNGDTEEVDLGLAAIPARIQGRLSAEDEQARVEEEPFEPHQNRVWHRIAQNGVNFLEHKLIKLLNNATNNFSVDTDSSGHYTILIPPGIFGIQIPSMTEYSGHNIEFGDLTTFVPPAEGPWPYPDVWPYSTYEDGHHGAGLRFDSGHEYQVDMFLHRQFINLVGLVQPKGEPFQGLGLVLAMKPDGSSVQTIPYNHLADVGAEVVATGSAALRTKVKDGGYYNLYILKDLKPGTYNITLDSSEYTTPPVSVTIAPWRPPGIVPSVPPLSPTYFFPGINHYDSAFTLNSQWSVQGKIAIEHYLWEEPQNAPADYVLSDTSPPEFFRMSGLPDELFQFNSFAGGIPAPSYTVWRSYEGAWFSEAGSGSQTFTAYDGGPFNDVFDNDAPSGATSYTLDLHAYSVADPHLEIQDVLVQFPKSVRAAGGQVAHDDSPYPVGATNKQWFYNSSVVKVENAATRLVRVDVLMRRAMVVNGLISSANGPVPNAAVLVRNRYGNPIGETVTAGDGTFSVPTLTPQSIYVDVNRRGFIPQRTRFEPPPGADPDISANFTLKEVPPPSIDKFTLNRHGLFLPGVLKSANSADGIVSLPNLYLTNASEYLKVTWKTETHTQPFSYTLQGTVMANEAERPPETFTVNDPVTEVWIVDRRAFKDTPVNDPTANAFDAVNPPAAPNYVNILKWLGEIQSGQRGGNAYHVVHQQVHRGDAGVGTNKFQGKFNLWEMPSGVFNPRIIAITENGGVAVKDYELPASQKPLQGMTMPTWAATFTEVISYVAGVGKFKYDVKGKYGDGDLQIDEANTAFEAKITLEPLAAEADPTLDATLLYKYVMGVEMKIGQTNTPSGPMFFAPAFLGTTIGGLTAEFKVTGKDQKATLNLGESGPLPYSDAWIAKKLPSFIESLAKVKPKVVAKQAAKFGQSQYLDSDWLGNNLISGYSYSIEGQASFEASVKADITPFVSKLPYIGQALTVFNNIPKLNLKVFFVPVLGLGGKLSVERITSYPRISGTTVSAPVQGVPFDFMGTPTNINKAELKLFAKIGASLLLSGFNEGLEGSAGVQLGAPRNSPDSTGVTFKFDPASWPPLRQITGSLSAVAKVLLKAWGLSYEKQWQWDALPFDFKFGGKSSASALHGLSSPDQAGVMDISPLHITYTVFNPATAPPYQFVGKVGNLVQNFYRAGSMSVVGGATPLLAFTAIDPNSGKTTIMISTHGRTQWNSPVPVANTGGILSMAVAPLQAGGWIAVWSEIDLADLGNPYPSTVLKYSVSTPDGTFWSDPAVVSAENDAIFDVKAVSAGKQTILTWQSTADGPQHQTETISSSVFDGQNWSVPAPFFEPQKIKSTSLAGQTNGSALLALANANNQLVTIEWNGDFWSTSKASDSVAGSISVAPGPAGSWAVAWQTTNNAVLLAVRQGGSDTWPAPVLMATNITTPELQLASITSGAENLYVLAWVQGGDVNSLYYAITDGNGQYRLAPTEVTVDSAGSYSKLQIRPLPGAPSVSLTAQYNVGTNNSLTELIVGLPSAGDCDGDGVADAVEIADGLLADCNHNGIPDRCEIASGAVEDLNHNGIPDTCETAIADDCNRNGISDAYELSLGIGDVNGNGVLDDCENSAVTRSVPLTPDVTTHFYRATRLQVTTQGTDTIGLEYIGILEESQNVDGPWFVVP